MASTTWQKLQAKRDKKMLFFFENEEFAKRVT